MNNQFFQQAEQFFKPMTEIMALNARTFEALAEKQNGLMSSMWSDGMNHARELSGKTDIQSFYATQRDYMESCSQRFSATARDSYNLLTEAQEEIGKLVQDSMSHVQETVSNMDFPTADFATAAGEPFARSTNAAQQAAQEAAKQATEQTAETARKATKAAPDSGTKAQSGSEKVAQEAAKKNDEAVETAHKATAKAGGVGSTPKSSGASSTAKGGGKASS